MAQIRSGAVDCGAAPVSGSKAGWVVATAAEIAAAAKGSAVVAGWVRVATPG
jgi:hypothetical protein